MLEKGDFKVVTNHLIGFYNKVSLVEKATGEWKPATNLWWFSLFIRHTKFWILTVASAFASTWKGRVTSCSPSNSRVATSKSPSIQSQPSFLLHTSQQKLSVQGAVLRCTSGKGRRKKRDVVPKWFVVC